MRGTLQFDVGFILVFFLLTNAFCLVSRFELHENKFERGMTSQLTIKSTDRLDSALYSCVARNPFGHDETSLRLFVLGEEDD